MHLALRKVIVPLHASGCDLKSIKNANRDEGFRRSPHSWWWSSRQYFDGLKNRWRMSSSWPKSRRDKLEEFDREPKPSFLEGLLIIHWDGNSICLRGLSFTTTTSTAVRLRCVKMLFYVMNCYISHHAIITTPPTLRMRRYQKRSGTRLSIDYGTSTYFFGLDLYLCWFGGCSKYTSLSSYIWYLTRSIHGWNDDVTRTWVSYPETQILAIPANQTFSIWTPIRRREACITRVLQGHIAIETAVFPNGTNWMRCV